MVENDTRLVEEACDGIETAFNFAFRVLAKEHLYVVKRTNATLVDTVQVLDVDYTVTGVGVRTGGTVNYTVAPTSGENSIIERQVPYKQLYDFRNQGNFRPRSVEDALDFLMMAVQQSNGTLAILTGSGGGIPLLTSLPPASAFWTQRKIHVRGATTNSETREYSCAETSSTGVYEWIPQGTTS